MGHTHPGRPAGLLRSELRVGCRALVEVAVQLPAAGGLALAGQLYSPHLDLHQRLLILDCLGQAAGRLAHSPLGLDGWGTPARWPRATASESCLCGACSLSPQLCTLTQGRAWIHNGVLGRPEARGVQPAAARAQPVLRSAGSTHAPEGSQPGRARRWASAAPVGRARGHINRCPQPQMSPSSGGTGTCKRLSTHLSALHPTGGTGLSVLQAAAVAVAGPACNHAPGAGMTAACTCHRFAPVALQWAAALLRDSDRVRQGVDLFGRDALLLGRVLVTLVRPCLARACAALPRGMPVRALSRRRRVQSVEQHVGGPLAPATCGGRHTVQHAVCGAASAQACRLDAAG